MLTSANHSLVEVTLSQGTRSDETFKLHSCCKRRTCDFNPKIVHDSVFQANTLLLCYPVTLVTLLPCYLFTLLPLLPCYLCYPFYSVIRLPLLLCYPFYPCYPVTLVTFLTLFTLLSCYPCYSVTLLPCYPVTLFALSNCLKILLLLLLYWT